MRRVLVPVTKDLEVDRVERELGREPAGWVHVVILNVQPEPVQWQTRGLFREKIRDNLLDQGRMACRPVEERLQAAGIPYHTRVELGEHPRVIVRCAREERCDRILLEADRLGWLQRVLLRATGWLAGSTAGQVIHFSPVPVTVVH